MTNDRPAIRIGEVARRTGVAVATLRAWERRYGLLDPTRTDGGHRLYSERDVQRVAAMAGLIDEGWAAAQAAQEAGNRIPAIHVVRDTDGDVAATWVRRLQDAFERFDPGAADDVLDDVFARLEPPAAFDDVVVPALRWVGEGWRDDAAWIAREHVASNVLRPRLLRAIRSGAPVATRHAVACAPETEEHELGLFMAAATAVSRGWSVDVLGARTPVEALTRTVAERGPRLVLVAAALPANARRFVASPPDVGDAALLLGGPGFAEEDAAALPGAVLHTGGYRALVPVLDEVARGRRPA